MRVAGNLLVSGCSGASGACSDVAEELSDLINALPNNPVYPLLCRPQAKLCLSAVHVEGLRGNADFRL